MPAVSPQGLAGVYGAATPETLTTTLRDAGRAEMRPLTSPLRAGPSRVVLTPVAGVKGWSACLANRPQETTGSDAKRLPNSSVPTVTNKSVSIAAGESTKQAEKTIACGTPDVTVLSW